MARHQRFGTSSEKQNPQQGELFDEAESLVEEEDALQTDVVTIPGYARKKAGRKPLPAHLPRIEVVHDLADDEKVCA